MSIFNVGTGREPAEIGVAEYQKPDYQQFEKLANVNMALKQQELEKAQKKTKEWGDILNTDFSTKYAVEQSQYVQKNIQSIKDDLMKDVSKNPDLLNDPTTIMQVKARLNQVKGYVKTLDEQAENIIKQKSEFEKDTKGIAYDKQYGKEYFEAQDNPIEFYKNNPDSEVGKTLGVIINSPQIQAITDPDQKRFAIRASLQALPMKKGTIATDTSYTGGDLGFDIYDASSNTKGSNRYSRVSEVSAINKTMNWALEKSDANANARFTDIIGNRLEQKYGSNLDAYKQQLKSEYTDMYKRFEEQYKGDGYELPRETLSKMKKPEELTDDDLYAFEYSKQTAPSLMKKAEMSNTKNIVNVSTGGGNKKKTISGTTNTRVKIPSAGGFSQTDVTTTVIDPVDQSKTVQFNNVYIIKDNGHLERLENSTTTVGITAPMKQVQTSLIPVYKNKFYTTTDGLEINATLSENERQKMMKNPDLYKDKVVFMTAFAPTSITTQSGSKKTDSAIAFAKYDQNALNIIRTEAEEQGYTGFYPTEAEYSFDEGLKYYNEHIKIRAPKKTINR